VLCCSGRKSQAGGVRQFRPHEAATDPLPASSRWRDDAPQTLAEAGGSRYKPCSMVSELGVAVVGVGRWGENLVRTLSMLPGVTVTALCDVEPRRLGRWAARLPSALCTASLPMVLDRPSVQAVAIATPPEQHVGPALMALESGRHVFVEKPLATSFADALRLLDAARASGRVLMVGHILEHHPAVKTLCAWMREGYLGRLKRIETWRLGASGDSPNAWWTLAPHDLSVVRLLLGAPLRLGLRTDPVEPDRMKATLDYPGNVQVSVTVGANHPTKVRRIRVTGTRRTVVFDDTCADKLCVYERSALGARPLPRALPAHEPLLLEMESFVASALRGSCEQSDGLAGTEVVKWLEAGSSSLRLGAPVWLGGSPCDAREAHARTA
jgi:UDP-2-acetamido-3-amino-2,3-dideoxy-glucuronate N-acetyltransferase